MPTLPVPEDARVRARRQLARVLVWLALLDSSVLVLVVSLAVIWSRYHVPAPVILTLVLGGVGTIILVRIALGVRLKRRSGEL